MIYYMDLRYHHHLRLNVQYYLSTLVLETSSSSCFYINILKAMCEYLSLGTTFHA